MSGSLDPNQVAAQVVAQQISSITDFASAKLSELIGNAQVKFKLGLKSYLDTLHARLSKVKTLLYRDVPIPIEKIYVGLTVKLGKQLLKDSSLIKEIEKRRNIVITGTAGSGKSMLMRHLFLEEVGRKKSVPIFFELRNLNATSEGLSMIGAMVSSLGTSSPFTEKQLELGLRLGIFTLNFYVLF